MKPIWHGYLVLSLGICTHETFAEAGLIGTRTNQSQSQQKSGQSILHVVTTRLVYRGKENKVDSLIQIYIKFILLIATHVHCTNIKFQETGAIITPIQPLFYRSVRVSARSSCPRRWTRSPKRNTCSSIIQLAFHSESTAVVVPKNLPEFQCFTYVYQFNLHKSN